MTDEQLREIYADEMTKRGWKQFADEIREGDTDSVDDAAVAAMRRVYDLARKQEAAMWELAAESQRLKLD